MATTPSHERHLALVMDNSETIKEALIHSMIFYFVTYWVLYALIDLFAKGAVASNPESTWKNFTEQS